MKKENPLLSIFIPTYNRKDRLFELINSIAQIKIENPDLFFEVVISDNSSTDETPNFAHQAIKNNIVDFYIRKRVNEGADGNILDCFKYTSGDFVWILCDDDLPFKSSVRNITDVIASHGKNISLIYTNRRCEWMNGDCYSERVSDCEEGIEYSQEKILKVPGVELLTASSLVIKRQVESLRYVREFGLGKGLAPLAMALDALDSAPFYLFSQPQVLYREGDKSEWISQWPTIRDINIPMLMSKFAFDHDISDANNPNNNAGIA